MAVVKVLFIGYRKLHSDGTQATGKARFLTEHDSQALAPIEAFSANDGTIAVPAVNSVFNGFTVRGLDIDIDEENPTFVTVEADLVKGMNGEGGGAERWDITISGDAQTTNEQVTHNRKEEGEAEPKPIMNTAFQPLPVEERNDDSVYELSFQSATINPDSIDPCRGKINMEGFTLSITNPNWSKSFEPRTVLLDRANDTCTVGQGYWQHRYSLVHRPDGWDRKILNMGTMELILVDGKLRRRPIWEGGQRVSEPVPLDENGIYLPPDDDLNPYVAVQTIIAKTKKLANFAPLFEGL